LVTNGLGILSVLVGFQGFVTHFLDEVLFQDVVHINDLFLLGDTKVALGILSSLVIRQPSYLTWTILISIMSFFGEFQQENYASLWEHYGSKVMGIYSGPLSEVLGSTTNLFWWYKPFMYGGLCPIYFSKESGFGGSISMLQVSYFQ
jgi:hypothetical protein